jgi:hypothetical protein
VIDALLIVVVGVLEIGSRVASLGNVAPLMRFMPQFS